MCTIISRKLQTSNKEMKNIPKLQIAPSKYRLLQKMIDLHKLVSGYKSWTITNQPCKLIP